MSQRPNVLVILMDQLRACEMDCYGANLGLTPNMDRFSGEGTRFACAVTPSPLCSPARSCLLSGQYARTCTGTAGNADGEPLAGRRRFFPCATLPEQLRNAGYETYLTGKWHIADHPAQLGFQHALYPKVHHRNRGQDYYDETGRHFVEEGYGADLELATTRRILAAPHDRPFFLYHNIYQPHMPYFDMPERYRTLIDPETVALRPNAIVGSAPAQDEEWFHIYMYDYLYYQEHLPFTRELPPSFNLRHLTALYRGMVRSADDQVGEVLDALAASGHLEDTIVVIASDHGDNLGSHSRFNKESSQQEALRVPLMVRWPGRVRQQTASQLAASLVDVAPTLLGLLGLPIPAGMQGRNLAPLLQQGEEEGLPAERNAYFECVLGEVGIHTTTHCFALMTDPETHTVRDSAFRFTDFARDPYELENLAKTGGEEELARSLQAAALRWHRETPRLQAD